MNHEKGVVLWKFSQNGLIDRGGETFPIAAGSGYIYLIMSLGFDDDGSAMTSFVETSPMDMGDGEKFVFKRVIPDLTFTGSVTGSSPNATFTVKARDFQAKTFLKLELALLLEQQQVQLKRLQINLIIELEADLLQ